MTSRGSRSLYPISAAGLLLFGAYSGCVPDLDSLSSGNTGSTGNDMSAGGSNGSSGSGGAGEPSGTSSGGTMSGSGAGGKVAAGGDGGGNGNTGGGAGVAGGGGEAGAPCESGLTTCPGTPECSTDLKVGNPDGSTVTDCGSCGVTCTLENATGAECSDGICDLDCEPDFGDCNAEEANDGCEADLTTLLHCGSCGHACPLTGVETVMCDAGSCVLTCGPRFADCNDGTPEDGCEVFLDSLTACQTDCNSGATACAGTQVCNSGSCVEPQGMTVFTVPFTMSGQGQRYGNKFVPPVDLTNSGVTTRLYAPGVTNGTVVLYLSDGDYTAGPTKQWPLTDFADGWKDISIGAGTAAGDFDPVVINQLTIELYSGNGPWDEPTVVYVDGIRTDSSAVDDTFDASYGNMVTSSLLKIDGSTFTWTDSLP